MGENDSIDDVVEGPRTLYDACQRALNPESFDPKGYTERNPFDASGMDALPRLQDDPPRYDDESLHRLIDIDGIDREARGYMPNKDEKI
jgi:hypothetical protein